jgi:hypothetical protein
VSYCKIAEKTKRGLFMDTRLETIRETVSELKQLHLSFNKYCLREAELNACRNCIFKEDYNTTCKLDMVIKLEQLYANKLKNRTKYLKRKERINNEAD